MKNFLVFLFLFSSLVLKAQDGKIPDKPPASAGLVHDYTNTLTSSQEYDLEQKLVAYDDSTSNQIAVVIINDLGNYSVEDYAIELGRTWGVGGQEQQDNGVVLLVAKANRKVTIQVGYGLEGAVTDVVAKSIIDDEILPAFREGNYYRGIDNGVDDIIEAAAGRFVAPENYGSRKDKGINGFGVFLLIVVFWIILGIISRNGRGGGGMVSRRGYRGWMGPTWIGTGGGSSGWSGGGGSSGGFGGFGGGSFGGGGASGSW